MAKNFSKFLRGVEVQVNLGSAKSQVGFAPLLRQQEEILSETLSRIFKNKRIRNVGATHENPRNP